jgi:UDP:flavonoid glycosyltransferase YjiC (YdhE family)
VRILVATTAGAGHFGLLVPFARACSAAGHQVRVAAPASLKGAVEQAGLQHVPVGNPSEAELASVFATLPQLSLEESNTVVVCEVFAGLDATAALPRMEAVVRDWQPDLIMRETAEFSSYVVAEAQGVPHVHVATGLMAIEEFVWARIDEALAALGSQSGTGGLRTAPVLSLVPDCLEDPNSPIVPTVHRFRAPQGDIGSDLDDWWTGIDAPLVYVTFGTVTASMGLFPDLYRAAIAAVAELPVRVLVTLGEAGDPDILGPIPANVHVERYWPQQAILTHVSAMVGHGGFGTTIAGLANGVPMVVMPLFALDQHYNAAAVTRAGAGISLAGGPAAMCELSFALERVLADQTYRVGARTVAADIARLPDPARCVPVLEAIAGHQPPGPGASRRSHPKQRPESRG